MFLGRARKHAMPPWGRVMNHHTPGQTFTLLVWPKFFFPVGGASVSRQCEALLVHLFFSLPTRRNQRKSSTSASLHQDWYIRCPWVCINMHEKFMLSCEIFLWRWRPKFPHPTAPPPPSQLCTLHKFSCYSCCKKQEYTFRAFPCAVHAHCLPECNKLRHQKLSSVMF